MTPKEAYDLVIGQGPSDQTRKAACREPGCAYLYARDVDEGPHDDTREGACQDLNYVFYYALNVDKCAQDDTRAAARLVPYWERLYVKFVDKLLHPVTLQAIPPIELANLQEQLEFD